MNSLASIYQVTTRVKSTYSYFDIWDLNLSLGETESDKKLTVAGGNSISHLLSGEQYCGGGKVSLFWFYTKILFHRGYGYNSHARPLPRSAGWAGSFHGCADTHDTDGASVRPHPCQVITRWRTLSLSVRWFSPLLCLCPPQSQLPSAETGIVGHNGPETAKAEPVIIRL